MLLAGAPGSGKTTAVKSVLKPNLQRSAVVVEGIMARYAPAKVRLEQFIAAGLKPVVVFVYRPFEDASGNVIERTVKEGRPIALANLGATHYQSQEVFFRLAREFGGQANFKVLFNDGRCRISKRDRLMSYGKNRMLTPMKESEKTSDPKEKVDPKKLYCGWETKEELEAWNREFTEDLKKGAADWVRDHPNGELPEVY